jgi:hypothetical protein
MYMHSVLLFFAILLEDVKLLYIYTGIYMKTTIASGLVAVTESVSATRMCHQSTWDGFHHLFLVPEKLDMK